MKALYLNLGFITDNNLVCIDFTIQLFDNLTDDINIGIKFNCMGTPLHASVFFYRNSIIKFFKEFNDSLASINSHPFELIDEDYRCKFVFKRFNHNRYLWDVEFYEPEKTGLNYDELLVGSRYTLKGIGITIDDLSLLSNRLNEFLE